jgi:hypothetical protein
MAVIEGVQLVYEPLRMHPAQRVTADGELPGVIAQHHGVAQKSVRLDAAPQSAFGGDPDWIGHSGQRGEAEPIEMRLPRGPIGEACLRVLSRILSHDGARMSSQ